jgi:hypothetical protein
MAHPAQVKIRSEQAGTMFGVEGRFFAAFESNEGFIATQTFKASRDTADGGRVVVKVRFDDNPVNHHECFAIGGDYWTAEDRKLRTREPSACGCIHGEIAAAFPELAHLVKWHLTSVDGPMHYIANTVYHAGNRDYRGLLKGETRPLLRGGRPGAFCYEWRAEDGRKPYEIGNDPKHDDAPVTFRPTLQMIEGEGKERELDHARASAVWPEATDAELCQEPDALRAVLAARLPSLLAAFRADMEGAGFLWPSRLAVRHE